MNDKAMCKNCTDEMIEEMAKLDIEESAGFYSAFINDMRISKNKPLSSSKTVMSFNCPKKYILNAIGFPEGSVVLTKEEYELLKSLEESYDSLEKTKDNLLSERSRLMLQTIQARKETAKEIFEELYTWLRLEEISKYGFVTIQKFDFLRKFREIIKQFGVEVEECQ